MKSYPPPFHFHYQFHYTIMIPMMEKTREMKVKDRERVVKEKKLTDRERVVKDKKVKMLEERNYKYAIGERAKEDQNLLMNQSKRLLWIQ